MLGKFVKVLVAPGKQEIGVVVAERRGSSDIAFLRADLRCVTHGAGVGQYLVVGEEVSVDPKPVDKPKDPMTTTGEGQEAVGTTEKEPEPHDGEAEGKKETEKQEENDSPQ